MSLAVFTPELKLSYKNLIRSLVRSSRRSRIQQLEGSQKKQIALLKYDMIKLHRALPANADESTKLAHTHKFLHTKKQIEALESSNVDKLKSLLFYPNLHHFKNVIISSPPSTTVEHLDNRIKHMSELSSFLINQSEYDELVERYNPGMRMTQEENVKRTAARVGLQVPAELQ